MGRDRYNYPKTENRENDFNQAVSNERKILQGALYEINNTNLKDRK